MNNPLTIAEQFQEHTSSPEWFAAQYYEMRKNEGRIYTDTELRQLPHVDSFHIYHEEWQVRKNSCNRLLKWLKQKQGPISILEIGCGNGWLTAQMASVENTCVTGADINGPELEQAGRVFGNMPNINFVYGDLYDEFFEDKVFDVIVFAASIQYFSSVKQILKKAMEHVSLQGEIHIIDTHLYKTEELETAAERTKYYFTSIGFAEMAECYFHHGIEEVKKFDHKILYDPSHWLNKFGTHKNPFYHVVITNGYQ
jgi:ubiquinone/menaquinone biosynthesis C-methylase UbiE